jgi:hypothetical protein
MKKMFLVVVLTLAAAPVFGEEVYVDEDLEAMLQIEKTFDERTDWTYDELSELYDKLVEHFNNYSYNANSVINFLTEYSDKSNLDDEARSFVMSTIMNINNNKLTAIAHFTRITVKITALQFGFGRR